MEYLKKALKDSFDKIFVSFSTYTDIESGNGNKIRIENNINFYNVVTTIYFIRKDENDNRDIISIVYYMLKLILLI